jgi:hypothetical protein
VTIHIAGPDIDGDHWVAVNAGGDDTEKYLDAGWVLWSFDTATGSTARLA